MFEKRSRLIYGLFWIAFANGLIASAISFRAIIAGNLPESGLGLAYLVLQQIGHFQFFSWLLSLPLVLLAIVLPLRRMMRVLAFVLFTAFLLLVYANYEVYQLYRFHFNSMVWNLMLGGGAGEILIFEFDTFVTLFGVIAMALVLQGMIFWFVRIYQAGQTQIFGKYIFLLIFAIQLTGQGMHAWADAWQRREIISQVRYVPLPHPLKLKRFLRKRGWLPEIERDTRIAQNVDGDFRYPLKAMQCKGSGQPMNLMIVISDGLRADMLNPSVMPFWSELSQNSLVFRQHYSSGNATRFGVFGLLSGLHGQYWFDAVANSTTAVLFSELIRRQYRFGFFANARLTSPEFDRAIFYDLKAEIPAKTPGKTVIERELEITRQAREFIEQADSDPFFSLVFFDAPHAYVYPPEDARFEPALESLNYLELDNGSDPIPFKNRYQNSIAFNDRLTAEIFQNLERSGQLENTIIVLTGDHGQEMNETRTNSWGHNSNFSKYQLQVPMVIHWPGKSPAEFDHLSSHVDLVPTLMRHWLGCENDIADYSNGRSLFDTSPRAFVLSKNWNDHAIVGKDLTRVFTPYGSDVYLSDEYQKVEDAAPLDSAQQLKVLESVSRFYQK